MRCKRAGLVSQQAILHVTLLRAGPREAAACSGVESARTRVLWMEARTAVEKTDPRVPRRQCRWPSGDRVRPERVMSAERETAGRRAEIGRY